MSSNRVSSNKALPKSSGSPISQPSDTSNLGGTQPSLPNQNNSLIFIKNDVSVKTDEKVASLFSKTEPSFWSRAWGDLTPGGKLLFVLGIATVIPGVVYLGKKYFFPSVDLSPSGPSSTSTKRNIYEERFLSKREIAHVLDDLCRSDLSPEDLDPESLENSISLDIAKAYMEETLTEKKKELLKNLEEELSLYQKAILENKSPKEELSNFFKNINKLKLLIELCDRDAFLSDLNNVLDKKNEEKIDLLKILNLSGDSTRDYNSEQILNALEDISKLLSSVKVSDCLKEDSSQPGGCMFQLDLNPFQKAMKDAVLKINLLEKTLSYGTDAKVRKECFPKLKEGFSQLFESSARKIYKELERMVKTGQGVFIKGFSYVYEIPTDPTAKDIILQRRNVQLESEIINGIKTTKSKKSNTSRIDAKGKQRIILALKNRLILTFIKNQAGALVFSTTNFKPDIDDRKSPNS